MVTVDVTSAPVVLACTKVDAAIRRKLFKVLATHVAPSEHVTVDSAQQPLLAAAFDRFQIPTPAREDVLQSLGDCLRAGMRPVALKCTLCMAWHVDVGAAAVQPSRVRMCATCGGIFRSAFPLVAHPLSLLQPVLRGTQLTFL